MRDFKDTVIEELADGEAELRERVESLEQDVQSYRALAQEAIHALHAVAADRDRLCDQLVRLRDECRALREQLMREAA